MNIAIICSADIQSLLKNYKDVDGIWRKIQPFYSAILTTQNAKNDQFNEVGFENAKIILWEEQITALLVCQHFK
jgi:hypothetical protein